MSTNNSGREEKEFVWPPKEETVAQTLGLLTADKAQEVKLLYNFTQAQVRRTTRSWPAFTRNIGRPMSLGPQETPTCWISLMLWVR